MRVLGRSLVAVLCAAALLAPSAKAAEPTFVFFPEQSIGEWVGPCGVGVDSGARFYVSDYYERTIDIYSSARTFQAQVRNLPALEGPCSLALDAGGVIYAADYHREVQKFTPSDFPPVPTTTYTPGAVIDSSDPTGVAVEPSTGTVYVNARTEIHSYDSTGTALPTIGAASITDGYGIAISQFPATLGRLYVPDHATDTVKVYDPLIDLNNPVQEITGPPGGFGSLRDSAVAVDHVSGDVYVADTLAYPQYSERPEAAVHVFAATSTYKGRLKYNVIDGSPVGLAVDNSNKLTQGRVYLTSGNGPQGSVYAYAPGSAGSEAAPAAFALSGCSGATQCGQALAQPRSSAPAGPPAPAASSASSPQATPSATPSATTQKGTLRIKVSGSMAPKRLPRDGAAPISVSVGGQISTTDSSLPPQLKRMRIELNKEGRLDYQGLPPCSYPQIQPGSSSRALSACKDSLVGEGSFTADITLSGQEPYPTTGKLLVFYSTENGKPVLYGHIYSPKPFATSFVIVFKVQKLGKGTYGTALDAPLPAAMDAWGRLTGLEMTLSRRYTYKGKARSFISAGCPAPKGFSGATFPLAKTEFSFAGGKKLSSVLSSSCKARG